MEKKQIIRENPGQNPFVFYRGVKDRGNEIIMALMSLGGRNPYGCIGNNPENYYYIDFMGNIMLGKDSELKEKEFFTSHYTEAFLPPQTKEEDKPKQVYYGVMYDQILMRKVFLSQEYAQERAKNLLNDRPETKECCIVKIERI